MKDIDRLNLANEEFETNQIDELLKEFSGRIMSGPSQNGVYTIAIGGEISGEIDAAPAAQRLVTEQWTAEQLDQIIRRLSNDPRVRFAGMAFGNKQPEPR